jgi:hypothetical protein
MNSDIKICKWYHNADSPVLFMIDDLANVWIDVNGNGEVDLEEDWGYAKNSEKSSFRYLKNAILKQFPDVKVTFFTPVGIRVGMIENPQIKSISKLINCDEETKKFFKSINNDTKFEIAYHGTTHGKVGKTNKDFKQEWELFNSLDEAIKVVDYGKEIYKDVFGEYPKGGKYCGYQLNMYSDESIDRTGFLWWCRYWNRGMAYDKNPLTNFDVKTFGENNVIDIPSTIDGGLLNGILHPNVHTVKGKIKKILKNQLINIRLNQINFLLKNKLIINIQEHMAPSRDDGRRQSPNIFDDNESLKHIFEYLKNKNVWYCTGSELAEYVNIRLSIHINSSDNNTFKIDMPCSSKSIVSLKFPCTVSLLEMPNGKIVKKKNDCFNVEIMSGIYKIIHQIQS